MFAKEIQTVYQMKDIIRSYFLLESDFEITFKKVEKSAYENLIFWGVCGKAHTPGTYRVKSLSEAQPSIDH